MKNTRLQNVCEGILERWQTGKQIQETQVHIFQIEIMNFLIYGENQKLPKSYYSLQKKVKETWHYHEYEKMGKQDIFLLGSLWDSMQLLSLKSETARDKMSIADLAKRYRRYEWFFATIKRYPGINHTELAHKGRKTTSELSQFVARISQENLYTSSRVGREKYYFLAERGEELLKEMRKAKENENVKCLDLRKMDENNTLESSYATPLIMTSQMIKMMRAHKVFVENVELLVEEVVEEPSVNKRNIVYSELLRKRVDEKNKIQETNQMKTFSQNKLEWFSLQNDDYLKKQIVNALSMSREQHEQMEIEIGEFKEPWMKTKNLNNNLMSTYGV